MTFVLKGSQEEMNINIQDSLKMFRTLSRNLKIIFAYWL